MSIRFAAEGGGRRQNRDGKEKCLLNLDAVLRHEGEEGDVIVVVGEEGVVG